MKSPLYPKTSDCDGSQYDPHTEFSQFLEEAKLHAKEISNFQTSSAFSEEYEEKKKKKSWKNLLLPWWKVVDKKSKPQVEASTNFHTSNKRKNYVSGPVYSNSIVNSTDNKLKFSTSGPLTSLVNSSRKADNEISYMCLDQLGSPNPNTQTYGPVYLVT